MSFNMMEAFGVTDDVQAGRRVSELKKQISALTAGAEKGGSVKKNQRPGKAGNKRYVILAKSLESWGKVPRQQADLAALLAENLETGKEYGEGEVFDVLMEKAAAYPSLCSSTQDVTYLFRYYRGLKNDGKHAGFVARNFLRMV